MHETPAKGENHITTPLSTFGLTSETCGATSATCGGNPATRGGERAKCGATTSTCGANRATCGRNTGTCGGTCATCRRTCATCGATSATCGANTSTCGTIISTCGAITVTCGGIQGECRKSGNRSRRSRSWSRGKSPMRQREGRESVRGKRKSGPLAGPSVQRRSGSIARLQVRGHGHRLSFASSGIMSPAIDGYWRLGSKRTDSGLVIFELGAEVSPRDGEGRTREEQEIRRLHLYRRDHGGGRADTALSSSLEPVPDGERIQEIRLGRGGMQECLR